MTNAQLQIKIKERLNKLASLDYDNFECWQIVEAFNKAQLEWVRRQIGGYNQKQTGDGSTKINYDDTQKLITTVALDGAGYSDNWVSLPHPADYMNYSSLYVMAKSDCCPDRNKLRVDLYNDNESRTKIIWTTKFDDMLYDAHKAIKITNE